MLQSSDDTRLKTSCSAAIQMERLLPSSIWQSIRGMIIMQKIQLDQTKTEVSIREEYRDSLSSIGDRMISCYMDEEKHIHFDTGTGLVRAYGKLIPLRDEFLELLKQSANVRDAHHIIASVMKNIYSKSREIFELKQKGSVSGEERNLVRILLNEIFVYLIAYLMRHGRFEDIAIYFCENYIVISDGSYKNSSKGGFNVFQGNYGLFDDVVSREYVTQYVQGTGQYWMDKFNPVLCDKEEFLLADVLCFNASIFKFHNPVDYWIPCTYHYGPEYDNSLIASFAERLKSLEGLQNIATAFGYKSVGEFKSRFEEVEKDMRDCSYRDLWYRKVNCEAALFCNYVNSQELVNC